MNFENFKKSTINPEQSSLSENNLNIKKKKLLGLLPIYGRNYIDKKTKEKFYRIDKEKNPEIQRLVSLLAKGVINVADVVKNKGKYFSHIQNMDNLGKSEYEHSSEMDADVFILQNIFGDWDKGVYQEDRKINGNSHRNYEHRNVISNDSKEKKYYFDLQYGLSAPLISDSKTEEEFIGMIKRKLSQDKKDRFFSSGSYIADPKPVLPIIKSKISLLDDRLKDRNFLDAIAKKAEFEDKLGNNTRFMDIKKRLDIVKRIVEEELEKLNSNNIN